VTWHYWLRYYPTLTETFVYDEARGLIEGGHRVRALAIGSRDDGAETQGPGWTVLHPPSYREVVASSAKLALSSRGRAAARWLGRHQRTKQVAKALWAATTLDPADRVHVHFAGEAAEWARAAWMATGVPYGVTVHAADLYKPRPSLAAVLEGARVVVTISRFNQRVLRERYGFESHLVRCGIDQAAWPRVDAGASRRILSVGRPVPKKGFDLLLEAVEQLEDAQLDLVGGATSELAGVTAHGPLKRSQVAALVGRAGVFALPCRTGPDGDRDGLPVAMMEAMAAGIPVVTTRLPGLSELVDERCGWVVPQEDVHALRDALADALGRPEERRRRGERARERIARRFSLAGQVSGLQRAWQGA